MKANKQNALALLGAAALLTGPLWVSPAAAQGPGGGFGGGGFGGPGGGGFGGPGGGGGQGGFNRRSPFAYGTVSAVNAGAGTVTISSRFGGGDQVIQTQGTTQIVSQAAAKVSDLKKGDKVEVSGMPTQMTATSLTIGDSPLAGLGGPGGPGGPPPGGPGGGNAAGNPADTRIMGTVTGTSPLTIALSPTASLTLKMDPSAKVTKYTPVTLNAIKPGDKVAALGTANDDGSFAATTLAVNTDLGAMGRGFGRRGGYGGQNGPGGFGGPGGQGMGRPGMPPSRGMGGPNVPPSQGMGGPPMPDDMPPPPGQ